MRFHRLLLLAVFSLNGWGCANRIDLDEEVRANVGDEQLRQLQCYVSSDIVLHRVLKSEERGVSPNHTLRVDKDVKLEEIVIAANTPGILIKVEPKRLLVSFEPPIDGKDPVLTFERAANGSRQAYFFLPDRMSGSGEMLVDYGGKTYTARHESRVARLEVERDRVTVESENRRKVPGRKLSEEPSKEGR